MSKGIGAKLYLDGEKEFKSAVSDINSNLRVLKSELRLSYTEFEKGNKTVGDAKRQNEILSSSLAELEERLETQKQALMNASKEYGDTDKKTNAWRESIARTQAEINKTERAIESNNEDIAKSGSFFHEASDETRLFGQEMDNTGQKAISLGDLIKANLISETIIGGVRKLGEAMKSVVGSAIDFAKDGVAFNSMIQDYETSFTTMTGSAETAKEMMEDIKKTAKETPFEIDGMADSVKQMMAYGIEGKKSLELTKLLGDVSMGNNEAMNSMAYAMGQISSAGKLNGQDLRQLINAGFNPLEEMSRKTGRSMADLQDDMSKGLITYQDVEDALKSITSEGGRFEGAMENASKTFSGQTAMMEEGMDNLKGMVTEGLFESLADSVMPMINGWIDELTEGFETDGIDGLIGAIENIIPQAMDFLSEQLPMILEIGMGILETIAQGIIDSLPNMVEPVTEILLSLVDFVIENLPMIIEVGMELLMSLAQGIISAIPELMPKIVEVIVAIVGKLIENMPHLIRMGIELLVNLGIGIIRSIPTLLLKIGEVALELLGELGTYAGDFLSTGFDWLVEMGAGLVSAIPQLLVKSGEVVSDLWDSFKDIDWLQLGIDIITGIGSGLGSVGGWLVEQGQNLASNLFGGIKSFFGIQSPSKLMKDEVGVMLAKGLGIGFNDEMDKVNLDMEKAIPDIDGNLNISSNGSTDKIDILISLTQKLLEKNQDIYLDSGELIGATVGGMDLALSNNLVLKGRGR